MGACTRTQLARLTGLVNLHFVLFVGPYPFEPQWLADWMERNFAGAKLTNLVELPQLNSVSIALRTYSYIHPVLDGAAEQVPDPIKVWVKSAERRILGGRES
jgi:hypothetical protein